MRRARRGSAEIFPQKAQTVNTSMQHSYHTYIQYAVPTDCPQLLDILKFIEANQLDHEIHLARTRFWIERKSVTHTEFVLRYYHLVSEVKD